METWIALLLPFALIFARTLAMVAVLPIFSSASVPQMLKLGLGGLTAIFLAANLPSPQLSPEQASMIGAGVLMGQEILCGVAMGLAARLVFEAIQQGGVIISREMGFYEASIIDPTSGEELEPFGVLVDTLFILLFLAADGHHLLLGLICRSYQALPVAGEVDFGTLAAGVLAAGSAMLLLSLQVAAPVLAAFLVVTMVLGVLARVLPEMNILMTSLPLRIGMGLVMAIAMVPLLQGFTDEVAQWINKLL
jgi:flagellar biosynthetic protein FliR